MDVALEKDFLQVRPAAVWKISFFLALVGPAESHFVAKMRPPTVAQRKHATRFIIDLRGKQLASDVRRMARLLVRLAWQARHIAF